jgi:hypothetical protein
MLAGGSMILGAVAVYFVKDNASEKAAELAEVS